MVFTILIRRKIKTAVKFDFISFEDVSKKFKCNGPDHLSQENKLPIVIFDMNKKETWENL
jgi:uridylate kinase